MDKLAIAGAFGNPVLGFAHNQPRIGAALGAVEKSRLAAAMAERGVDFVGQEVVNLSTTPVWHNGRIEPRPFALRVYAARTPEGWNIMPGGFCRISGRADARAVSMGEGVQSADVWVLADKPVAMVSLLPTDETVRIRRIMGTLPSRAADNLFWLGRYLERSEATLRLIRCLVGRMIETGAGTANPGSAESKLTSMLVAWHAAPIDADSGAMALATTTMARPCRSCAMRAAPHRSFANGSRQTPGGLSAISIKIFPSMYQSRWPRPRLSSVPTRPCGRSRRSQAWLRKT
jgi:hypothetical protein